MAKLIFRNPLVLKSGTGLNVSTDNEELNAVTASVVTFSIPQVLSTSSSVVFNSITTTDRVNIDNGALVLTNSGITGSFTQVGNQSITSGLTISDNLTVRGILTAEKITTSISQSVTLFESGSTQFGNTLDDTHQRTGSLSMSGSTIGLNNFDVTEISNDTTLADESTTNIITENAVKTYLDDQTNDFQTYQRKSFAHTGSLSISGSYSLNNYSLNEISNDTTLADNGVTSIVTENAVKTFLDDGAGVFQTYQRKSFAHTGSFVSVSTASFTVTTASAPTGYTATSEDDFMFFVNGVIAEYDALTVQQAGSSFLLKVNNDSIGYDLQTNDEIVAFGKFNS